jgi:periplasmic protein TonB
MFEQSLLNTRGGWKRAMTVVLSTMIQVSLLMLLVVMPLVFPESVPRIAEAAITYVRLPQPPGPRQVDRRPTHQPQVTGGTYHPSIEDSGRSAPHGISQTIDMTPDGIAPGDVELIGSALSNGSYNPVAVAIGALPPIKIAPPAQVQRPKEKEQRPEQIHVTSIDPAKLLNRVQPIYPPLARQTRVQGVVVLEAVIGTTGRMERLRIVSGHPLLVQAAYDAVSQWMYRPTILNGAPVEVITTIEVNFTLSQ